MRIQCDIEGIDPQPPLLEFFDQVLRHAAGRVSLDLATIGRVVIVSPGRFGGAVDSIRPGATHTNTEIAVAGGKTMARREGDRVVSDIVLQSSLFEALTRVPANGEAVSDWGMEQEQAIYVVCHEFGHALDHGLRDDASEVKDPRANPFSIRETADYYGSIVLTEFAACRLSAGAMAERLFGHEMQEAAHRMTAYGRQVRHYLGNPDLLTPRALAQFVCQASWLYMAELTKLYGYADGAPARAAAVRRIEMELLEGTPLGDYLGSVGATYPKWDIPAEIGNLAVIWRRYAALSGVRFVARDEGPDEMVDLA